MSQSEFNTNADAADAKISEIRASWLPVMKKYRASSEDTEFLLRCLDARDEEVKRLREELKRHCYCEKLHPDTGGQCEACFALKDKR